MKPHDAAFAAAMANRRFGGAAAAPAAGPARAMVTVVPAAPAPVEPRDPSARSFVIGNADDTGAEVELDLVKLIEGRLLIQALSGGGKSWTLRRLLEQTAGILPQIVVDPEGEFGSLAERFGHVRLEAHRLDTAALALAVRRAREHRLSLLIDLSDLPRDDQVISATTVFDALIEAPREHWHPALVAVDEAHLFAPFGASHTATSVRKAATAALTDLMSRGRKRGLVGVLATQRLARLSKSVVSEAQNFMVGRNTLDLDIKRAAETIGWDARRGFDRLPMLDAGDFACVGPAFSRSPAVLHVGPVETFHRGSTPTMAGPAALDPGSAADLLDLDSLMEASAQDEDTRAEVAATPGLRAVRAFIRDPAFPLAGRIWAELVPLAPAGAGVAAIADHLKVEPSEAAIALELLDRHGAVEFIGEGPAQAVRAAKGMLP